VTEEQAEVIDEEWSDCPWERIDPHIDRRKLVEHREKLRQSSGREWSEADALWSLLNVELLQHARVGNWGLYVNTRLSMAAVLEREDKLLDALCAYFEVLYLDLNGPRNTGGVNDSDFPPFSPAEAFVAPAIESKVLELLARLQFDEFQARDVFAERTERVCSNLKLPVLPRRAWERLSKLFYSEA
jgi:hypothetical protein